MSEQERLIQDLKAENEALKARFAHNNNGPVTFKLAKKPGSISIGGFDGWPVTGPVDKLLKMFDARDQFYAFVKANKSRLGYTGPIGTSVQ